MSGKSTFLVLAILACLSGSLWAQVDLETLNVALDGTATAKNMCYGWVENNAIDGDDTTGYHSCAAAPEEWLEIALDQPYDLREVRLRNRHNCCYERIEGIIVICMDADRNVIWTSDPVPASEAGVQSSLHVFEDDGKRIPRVSIIRVEQTANFFVQIMEVEAYLYISPFTASNPKPTNGADDVLRDTDLAWNPGITDGTRNLYVGETFEDVNTATVPTVADLDVNSFDPARFEFGQTYYWRVDEVNATPDKTVHKGDVWDFEVEPYAIPIPSDSIIVTASSSSNDDSLPGKLLDGSGLGEDGTHAFAPETMWFTAAVDLDPWVMFDFNDVMKVDTMTVWNSNSSAEMAIGWGVKDMIIETSLDGETWVALAESTQLSRAPGLPTYNQPDAIDLGGVAARYVRLDIESNWGGILMSYGLAEVQFTQIPAKARTPEPASGATGVLPTDTIEWRAGREAGSHTIYVSTDVNAVIDGSAASVTSSTNSLDLTSLGLELGQTYYYRVDEVNEAEATSVWAGPVWEFSTVAALTVDDFESYGNESPDRPFQTWLDGMGYSADEFFPVAYGGNGTGAAVGHDIWSLASPHYGGDIMDRANAISGSSQSMPFYYNNTGGAASYAERTFASPQDWTIGDVKTLSINFSGAEGNTGTLFIKINDTKITYPHDSANLARSISWQAWNVDLTGLDVTSVTKLQIGVEGAGASGMLLIDDLMLYPDAGELLTPVAPSEGLIGAWSFDEGSGTTAADSSGNGFHGTVVDGAWEAGASGQAIKFNGLTAQVDLPPAAWDTIDSQVTVSAWIYVESGITQSPVTFSAYQDPADGNSRVLSTHFVWSNGNVYYDAGGSVGDGYDRINKGASGDVYGDAWIHWAFTKNAETGEMKIYRNGMLWLSGGNRTRTMTGVTTFTLGSRGGSEYWQGSLDEFQLYNRELTQEEILHLAGITEVMDKPF